jgi:hypothetical protein
VAVVLREGGSARLGANTERRAIDIATDILRLLELLANIAPDDAP